MSRVLVEKLIVTQLVRKFPSFMEYKTHYIVFRTAHYWNLSRTRLVQSVLSLFLGPFQLSSILLSTPSTPSSLHVFRLKFCIHFMLSIWATHVAKLILLDLIYRNTRVYPKVSGLAAWSENCKWYSSLPLCAVISLFCEPV